MKLASLSPLLMTFSGLKLSKNLEMESTGDFIKEMHADIMELSYCRYGVTRLAYMFWKQINKQTH